MPTVSERLDTNPRKVNTSDLKNESVQKETTDATERLMTKIQTSVMGVAQNRHAVDWLLGETLSRSSVEVSRTARTHGRENNRAERTVPAVAAEYMQEAAEAYVVGLHIAAVALCRAALEEVLKDSVPSVAIKKWQLAHLLKAALASKALPWREYSMATQVQVLANRVLHGSRCTADQAFDAVVRTRRVLDFLYAVRYRV